MYFIIYEHKSPKSTVNNDRSKYKIWIVNSLILLSKSRITKTQNCISFGCSLSSIDFRYSLSKKEISGKANLNPL